MESHFLHVHISLIPYPYISHCEDTQGWTQNMIYRTIFRYTSARVNLRIKELLTFFDKRFFTFVQLNHKFTVYGVYLHIIFRLHIIDISSIALLKSEKILPALTNKKIIFSHILIQIFEGSCL